MHDFTTDDERRDGAETPAAEARAASRRGRGRAVAAGLAITAVIAAWAVGHQALAAAAHAELWPAWVESDGRYVKSVTDYRSTAERGLSAIRRGDALLGIAAGDLVDPADVEALEAELALAQSVIEDRPAGPGIAALGSPDRFAPAWERYSDAWRMLGLIPERAEAAERIDDARDRVAERTVALADASERLVAGTEARALDVLAASPSATHRARFELEQAIDGLRRSSTISSGSGDRYEELANAVDEVRASNDAELARLAEHPVRAEIEDFARSISFDVPFDTEWADEVGGYSSAEYYSGTVEFPQDGASWGLMSLTFSIEDAWSWDENAKAVVVHEVGHLQALREECLAILTGDQFAGDHETWATAWAISMGYDLPGAGIEPYGRPTDAQVAAAEGCR
ncbi:hypothetical protein [Agromyces sp. SYSU T0242]|uniref:hypothetical protein n=1 Tax=Agromyces litoreus TaxID=3158561 RepID=UPI0033921866